MNVEELIKELQKCSDMTKDVEYAEYPFTISRVDEYENAVYLS
jgi:hypothetical protein